MDRILKNDVIIIKLDFKELIESNTKFSVSLYLNLMNATQIISTDFQTL